MIKRWSILVLGSLLALDLAVASPPGEIYDVLQLPAVRSERATSARLFGLDKAGERLVVVGQRGFILYSDDWGDSWQQADVPVRSTLLSVNFATPLLGWAAGHDGVVLHTEDGGETWRKQLDGYQAVQIGLEYYRKLAQENPDNEAYALLVGEMEFAQEQGADRPFLFVYFVDEQFGIAAGAYGLLFRTLDGGASWHPRMEIADNYGFRHMFDYEMVGDTYYSTGEMGMVLSQSERETTVKTVIPFYDGSFYTMISTESGGLIVAGLRANAFRSTDEGKTWQFLELPTTASVFGSARLQDGRVVLVTQAGEILLGNVEGTSFINVPVDKPFPFSGVIEGRPGELILVGRAGIKKLALK